MWLRRHHQRRMWVLVLPRCYRILRLLVRRIPLLLVLRRRWIAMVLRVPAGVGVVRQRRMRLRRILIMVVTLPPARLVGKGRWYVWAWHHARRGVMPRQSALVVHDPATDVKGSRSATRGSLRVSKIGNLVLIFIEGAIEAFRRRGEVRGCYLGKIDYCRARQDGVGVVGLGES